MTQAQSKYSCYPYEAGRNGVLAKLALNQLERAITLIKVEPSNWYVVEHLQSELTRLRKELNTPVTEDMVRGG